VAEQTRAELAISNIIDSLRIRRRALEESVETRVILGEVFVNRQSHCDHSSARSTPAQTRLLRQDSTRRFADTTALPR
jgi:hypothetical protein